MADDPVPRSRIAWGRVGAVIAGLLLIVYLLCPILLIVPLMAIKGGSDAFTRSEMKALDICFYPQNWASNHLPWYAAMLYAQSRWVRGGSGR